ncbi:MAG: protein-L-isoaspartate O-methyltransferase [Pseudomonadota bacterium]
MDTAKARKHMVDSQVRPNNVTSIPLQTAMATIPRERFVPADKKAFAYAEQDVPLFDGRWLLKARDFSKMINDTAIGPDDVVLDVACGYGYSTAVLSHLAGVVIGIEDDPAVVEAASNRLSALDLETAVIIEGDLTLGSEKQGPFDVIVIAGGVQAGIETLKEQLNPNGGRLVTIFENDRVGTATLIKRTGDAFGERQLFEAHPAGVIPAFRAPSGFAF